MDNGQRIVSRLVLFLLVIIICICSPLIPYADASSVFESEPNNIFSNADHTYNSYDNYGYISTSSDVDCWSISFDCTGYANFWLGNIPSGCNYDLRLYRSNESTMLASSLNSGTANELITYPITPGTVYYVKITSSDGSFHQ